MTILTAEFLYSGLIDYWSGNSERHDRDKGCLFAYYGKGTTVRDIVDSAVVDFIGGGDCDSFPDDVNDKMVREALLASLTDKGRADYHSGAISDFATNYVEANNLDRCHVCGETVDNPHDEDCRYWLKGTVEEEDCNEDEGCDSPMIVFLLRVV